MDADCIHGKTWWECPECEAALQADSIFNDNALEMFTIYDHPIDFPDSFAVVQSFATGGKIRRGLTWSGAPTLEEARDWILTARPGLVCLTRHPDDDAVIVETWL